MICPPNKHYNLSSHQKQERERTIKQLTIYNRVVAYLNTIFDLLNARYFENTLSRPVITIQSTPKAYGHYTLFDAWSLDGETGMREINIGAGTLIRPIENIVATLLHEMCHYYNDRNGVKDCSRGNTYHNKNFKAVAEACDLVVEHNSTYGWSITSPSDALLEFCVENNLTEIRLNRNDVVSIAVGVGGTHAGTFTGTAGRKPSSTRKYICPCCGMSVRATRNVNIACLDCNEPLVIAA